MTPPLDLDHRLDDWTSLGLWRHLCALALIVVVAVVRWHHCVLLDHALIDEETYLAAFRAKAAGGSPYEIGSYHYTPLFAWIGAKLLALKGELATLVVLRVSSLVGLAVTVWCSLAWLVVSWPIRLALALAFVSAAPAVGAGLCTGNISFAVIGVILVALITWRRHSLALGAVPSGLALGATVAAKPLAPLALVALFFHRASDDGGRAGRRHQIAGIIGGLTAAALLLPMVSRLGEMAAQPIHRLSYARSFSLQRLLGLAGVEVNALTVLICVALVLVMVLRLLPLERSQLVAVAVTASVLATPIVWNHTLLLTLPVQVMALAVAANRWRGRSRTALEGAPRRRSYELVLVVLGALALQFSQGVGAVDELSRAAQIAFISIPCFAPALLTAYLLVWTRARDGAGSSAPIQGS